MDSDSRVGTNAPSNGMGAKSTTIEPRLSEKALPWSNPSAASVVTTVWLMSSSGNVVLPPTSTPSGRT